MVGPQNCPWKARLLCIFDIPCISTGQSERYGAASRWHVSGVCAQVRCTPGQRSELKTLADIYSGQVAHLTSQTMTMEVIGTEETMESLQSLLSAYGVIEVARTGRIALARESRIDTRLLQVSQLKPYV